MEKTPEYLKARSKAVNYILYKPRTKQEVYRKLMDSEYEEKIVQDVVDALIELGYINDEEYTKKFIENQKKVKKLSINMIKLKLKNKGIPEEVIEKYIREQDLRDFDSIYRFLQKKKYSCELEQKAKEKIMAAGVRQGFRIGDIRKVIKEFYSE
ncbi:MAG: RecX family transcriptional regulator [Clostridia bacterium]|nr:RecX family transcriptional regulator [Clostridia bacterium]